MDGTAEKTAKGVRQAPDLCATVTAWPRHRRNSSSRSAAGRIKRHRRSVTFCPQLQPSSAVVSAVVHWHRGHCLRTAFVLTWFKIKERQASVSELLRNLKSLCRKGFPFQQVVGMLDVSLEIRRKRTKLPMGELRPSELTMIDKEILYMAMKIQNKVSFWLLSASWTNWHGITVRAASAPRTGTIRP